MTIFTDEPELKVFSSNTFKLTRPLTYQGKTDTFTVEAGFETDFASVPRIAVWLVPRFGRYTKAAIIHDWLCVQLADRFAGRRELSGDDIFVPANARDTDGIFRRIMREEGVSWLLRWLVWCGVRWGALFNPARRAGWWRDSPKVFVLSLLALPIMILPTIAITLSLALYSIINWCTGGGGTKLVT